MAGDTRLEGRARSVAERGLEGFGEAAPSPHKRGWWWGGSSWDGANRLCSKVGIDDNRHLGFSEQD